MKYAGYDMILVKGKARKPTYLWISDGEVQLEERRKNWLALIEKWREDYPTTYRQDEDIIKPQYVVECISELTKGEAIIATEVGQNQMWTAQFFKFRRPRSLITSGGLGTMGYGFPAAIGAQIGCRDRVVWDIAGDAGFQAEGDRVMIEGSVERPLGTGQDMFGLDSLELFMSREKERRALWAEYRLNDANLPVACFVLRRKR